MEFIASLPILPVHIISVIISLGFVITAVIIPVIGILAHAKLQGTMYDFGKKVYRRPLSAGELGLYWTQYSEAESEVSVSVAERLTQSIGLDCVDAQTRALQRGAPLLFELRSIG